MQALAKYNELDEATEHTKKMEREILQIVQQESDLKCQQVPELKYKIEQEWWSHMAVKSNKMISSENA